VDRRLDAALVAASINLPCPAADASVLRLLKGESSAVGSMVQGRDKTVSGEGGGGSADGKGTAAMMTGARAMLVHAIVHNVQFDWKAAFKHRAGGEEDKADASSSSSSLLVSAMREFATLQAVNAGQDSECIRRGGTMGAAGREGEDFGGGGGGLGEEVEAMAAGVMLQQARRQAEADLLLMCCHRTSTLLGLAPVPLCNLHDDQGGEGAHPPTLTPKHTHPHTHGGWWLKPSAVKSRALARLLRTSASESPRGHELLCRVEEAVRQLGDRKSAVGGQGINTGVDGLGLGAGVEGIGVECGNDTEAESEGPSMLDICLWALVLSDDEPAWRLGGEKGGLGGKVGAASQRQRGCDQVLSRWAGEVDSCVGARGGVAQEVVVLRLVKVLVHIKVPCGYTHTRHKHKFGFACV
jgi:hypothetical protein